MKIDPNAAAFPGQSHDSSGLPCAQAEHGLTIRAHFAAMAMQAYLSNPLALEAVAASGRSSTEIEAGYASDAVRMADILIAELNK